MVALELLLIFLGYPSINLDYLPWQASLLLSILSLVGAADSYTTWSFSFPWAELNSRGAALKPRAFGWSPLLPHTAGAGWAEKRAVTATPPKKFERCVFHLSGLISPVTCRGALLQSAADVLILQKKTGVGPQISGLFIFILKCRHWKCLSPLMNFVTRTKTLIFFFL